MNKQEFVVQCAISIMQNRINRMRQDENLSPQMIIQWAEELYEALEKAGYLPETPYISNASTTVPNTTVPNTVKRRRKTQ